jgi:Fur family ferric uptake transcriptional regulator
VVRARDLRYRRSAATWVVRIAIYGYANLAIISFTGHTVVMADPDGEAARLRSLGLGVTGPRRLVLAALRGRSVPASAGEVYDALRAGNARIALTSVYRVLHLFAQEGLVHVFVGDEQRYRLCTGEAHVHLVCARCGAVREEPADRARRWLRPASVNDFEVDVEHATLYGICGLCRTQPTAMARRRHRTQPRTGRHPAVTR